MFCSKWGAEIADSASFCQKCGTSITINKSKPQAEKPVGKVEVATGGLQFIIAIILMIVGISSFFMTCS